MAFNYNSDRLLELMRSFSLLTGLRFVFFDSEYNEILSYPENRCRFCSLARNTPELLRLCCESDRRSFEECRKTDDLLVYTCHAGLIEAVAPLKESGIIIGYLMFGQITDKHDRTELYASVKKLAKDYGLSESLLTRALSSVKYKSREKINAAAKIMEAGVSYIILKEMIRPSGEQLYERINSYIDNNLSDATPGGLCTLLGIGRSTLYDRVSKNLGIGISEYILLRRIDAAKRLLRSTDISVAEISKAVGYQDYNYFSRIFKRRTTKTPSEYRRGT